MVLNLAQLVLRMMFKVLIVELQLVHDLIVYVFDTVRTSIYSDWKPTHTLVGRVAKTVIVALDFGDGVVCFHIHQSHFITFQLFPTGEED